ncbi:hypothetical protein HBN50_03395 [Halobacteriovorax sp. GB3]|uniref:hypothetical protein n=1 Tax=Halobacteriovorax sp. GB3 TaxID=2719615 RepID=UPI00235FA387|nr:hypothetical protein [Halobacteriovorax sp. GB3]MDD0852122.1 hypothetical protein [Halobacteriovorax sp. GB3]
MLAENGEVFEIGGSKAFTHDPQCQNCASKSVKKKLAKKSAANEAKRVCAHVGAHSVDILDYDLDVNYKSGWLLNIGAPRSYYAVATAKCQF